MFKRILYLLSVSMVISMLTIQTSSAMEMESDSESESNESTTPLPLYRGMRDSGTTDDESPLPTILQHLLYDPDEGCLVFCAGELFNYFDYILCPCQEYLTQGERILWQSWEEWRNS